MSSSEFYICPVCNRKALYAVGEPADYVVVLHPDCFEQAKTDAAEAATASITMVGNTWEASGSVVKIKGETKAAAAIRLGINLAATAEQA
jgi:RNA polymerase subunit RPABC4/transcription elongation factor Spt4